VQLCGGGTGVDSCWVPTHRELPVDTGRRWRTGRGWRGPQKVALALLIATIAGGAIVGLEDVGERGHIVVDSPHDGLPGAYVAVPGSWHWRWVPVKNPLPGGPRYVRERYRTIHYVPAAP
jgi:hypothetical protein